jgi:hypothetical protein
MFWQANAKFTKKKKEGYFYRVTRQSGSQPTDSQFFLACQTQANKILASNRAYALSKLGQLSLLSFFPFFREILRFIGVHLYVCTPIEEPINLGPN